MKLTREEKALEVATEFVAKNSTVRKVASELGISKSTVHLRLVDFMESPKVDEKDRQLAREVRQLIEKNKQERHFRGGYATKVKFLELKAQKEKAK